MLDLEKIPEILQGVSMKEEKMRTLGSYSQLLKIAYELTDHPILKSWEHHEPIDLFAIDDFNSPGFKYFNRTLIERTITQAGYYSGLKSERGVITLCGKGIEYAIMELESFYTTANKLYHSTETELQEMGASVNYFRLSGAGKVSAAIKCFLEVCNDIISLVITHYIGDRLKKIETDEEKVKFLLRTKADFQQQQDQFTERVYNKIIGTIDIELNYHEKVKEHFDIPAELQEIVRQFLAEKKARVSSNKLMGFLIEERFDEFSQGLADLVMEIFSYHDIGVHEPEKVYHAFLLGVFNGFKDIYRLKSNKEAGNGRFDIMLIPDTLEYKGVIIEVKHAVSDKTSYIEKLLTAASHQIVENKYATELKALGHQSYLGFAAVFYGKQLYLRNEVHEII